MGGRPGDLARRCVLCLRDGMLDEPASGDFVDCELACVMIGEVKLVNGIRNGWSSVNTDVWRDPLRP